MISQLALAKFLNQVYNEILKDCAAGVEFRPSNPINVPRP